MIGFGAHTVIFLYHPSPNKNKPPELPTRPHQKPPLPLHNSSLTVSTMKNLPRALCFILGLFTLTTLTGCLQVDKLVKLNPDGSGTIEESVTLNPTVLDQFQKMAAGFGGSSSKKGSIPSTAFELIDEPALRQNAQKLGKGVEFVSAKKIATPNQAGFVALYSFTDINLLQLDQNPQAMLPKMGPNPLAAIGAKSEAITFEFKPGNPKNLAIKMPTPSIKPLPKKDLPEGAEEMAMQMFQQMIKGMKVQIAVEVAGPILATNAQYKNNSRITLLEMNFDQIFANPDRLKALAKADPKSLEDIKRLIQGIEGVKIETAETVNIQFQ